MNIAIFENKHFIIRPCVMADADDYLSFWNDPVVMKYIGDGTWGGGLEVVLDVLQKNIASYAEHPGYGFCSIEDKMSKKVVGEAGLSIVPETKEIEAGYILSREYWGRGLGSEILQGLLHYGFSRLHCDKIIAVAHPDNLASIRVMEKCGMTYLGKAVYHGRMSVKFGQSNPNH